MATKTNRPGKLAPCACSTFQFGQYGPDGSAESYESTGTGCREMTKRTFAMGHDAKLVGFLVRAERDGLEIRQGGVSFAGAVKAAASISQALAIKAEGQLAAAHKREAKKASRPVKAEVAPVVPLTREAKIKVGRWTYDATISATGVASYKTKLGKSVMLAAGEYKEI